jgi:hypothetical protein
VSSQIKLNGLDIEITYNKVIIYDLLDDVSPEEGEIIVKYLYSEGFISSLDVSLDIVRDDD